MRASRIVIALLLAMLVTACARDGEFEGYYVQRFEVSSFVPCGSLGTPGYAAGYWLDWGTTESYRKYESEVSSTTVTPVVYLRFTGHASSFGLHGHARRYFRQVTVGKVIEVSRNGKCR